MHDTYQWTVDAAPALIDGLQGQGYTLVTVDQIIGTPVAGQFYTDGQAPA
jgi:peptidoglycan/xylan/chitin deacetylase (PgdA/CDA1 family)